MTEALDVAARLAQPADVAELVRMYALLESEMAALHPMWPVADGLDEPIEEALVAAFEDDRSRVVIGTIEQVPFGFALGRIEETLSRGSGGRIGSIRLMFTELEAREVGVGEAMREQLMSWFREAGITWFDAHVLPGHRLAKNFYEAGGFSARSIVMHHASEQ